MMNYFFAFKNLFKVIEAYCRDLNEKINSKFIV